VEVVSVIATPTKHNLKRRFADFSTLSEALDYAAKGDTGCNFYSGTGELLAVLPYSELREDALKVAYRLNGLGLKRGDRVALVAETHPNFQRFFFGCQYAGLIPVPVPPPLQLGGGYEYVGHLRRLLSDSQARVCIGASEYGTFLAEGSEGLHLQFIGSADAFTHFPATPTKLRPLQADELAHLQYTSGSTRFPRGVMITQRAVMSNLSCSIEHLQMTPDDRAVSWLPYYHDMGLVGLVLAPVVSQMSVDYLGTREFAMRPRQWLIRMSESEATISFGPPFGYELCARRLRKEDTDNLDLSAWRVAGVGAETIRPEPLLRFAAVLASTGFDAKAFLPCYGLAESSLAVSFAPINQGLCSEWVDGKHLSETQRAVPIEHNQSESQMTRAKQIVNCGKALPGHEVSIRGENGDDLPARHCGHVLVRGPSVMSGYFGDSGNHPDVLSDDGWLDTGDIGYCVDGEIMITGRKKDLIIINGRNIWPQDVEYLAEQEPEVRPGDASAFSVTHADGREQAVVVIQCREADVDKRRNLVERMDRVIRADLGVDCIIDLVPLHTLIRTSSGKLSRFRTREDFMRRSDWGGAEIQAAG
jgi:fatty-acyl-CoA synthase